MVAGAVAYLDTSALAKLIVRERESTALRAALAGCAAMSSSALARVELRRLARRRGAREAAQAERVLGELTLLAVTDAVLDRAAALEPHSLRSLDAIHIASARELGDALGALVTYDRRMTEAAGDAGLRVLAPA